MINIHSSAVFFENSSSAATFAKEFVEQIGLEPKHLKEDTGGPLLHAVPHSLKYWESKPWMEVEGEKPTFYAAFEWRNASSEMWRRHVLDVVNTQESKTSLIFEFDSTTSIIVRNCDSKCSAKFQNRKRIPELPSVVDRAWENSSGLRSCAQIKRRKDRSNREFDGSSELKDFDLKELKSHLSSGADWRRLAFFEEWEVMAEFTEALLEQTNESGFISVRLEIELHEDSLEKQYLLTERLGGFVSSGLAGSKYVCGFDPLVRPDSVSKRAARFPCWRGEVNGQKIQVDIVHRVQGDLFFDFQVYWFNDKDAPDEEFLPELMRQAEVPFELWRGELYGRWESYVPANSCC